MVAQRATSPKAPKAAKTSRASSPLAQGNVQPNSRATSPAGSRAGSPTAPGKTNGTKRKAGEDGSSAPSPPNAAGGPPKAKKRKGPSGVPSAGAIGELDNRAVIEWLKKTPNANTRDCIRHFGPYLTDETMKSRFTAMIKDVAQLKGGVLVLRNAYRGESPLIEG